MSESQALLSKIAALRLRLDQIPAFGDGSGTSAAEMLGKKIKTGSQLGTLLDGSLRRLTSVTEPVSLPTQLTARARRLLQAGHELLSRLRTLGDGLPRDQDAADPLIPWYRSTVAMADSTLRMIGTFPDAPSVQLRLCEGLEVALGVITARTDRLQTMLARRRQEAGWVETLAEFLTRLSDSQPVDVHYLTAVAEAILQDQQQGAPLRFFHASPEDRARFVACHSLTVAQVMARLLRLEPDLGRRPLDTLLAALLHDAGMLGVPAAVLMQTAPLDDGQRRLIEGHTTVGAEWIARVLPGEVELAEAAADHHERLDGSGYPAGLRDTQLSPPIRLLAVCDVYAALATPRPHRPAQETRTALTDTLMLADAGALDRHHAERLLCLAFYPVGSVVELADGSVAVVIATPVVRRSDLESPARPIVALLTDARNELLPVPQPVDLTQGTGRGIVRALKPAERRDLLGDPYPEYV
jgi:HD-GYP domain-containing protein (c-di-GMP phosphodiesterase class II)